MKTLEAEHGSIDCLELFVLYLRDVAFDRSLEDASEFEEGALRVGTEVLFDVRWVPDRRYKYN